MFTMQMRIDYADFMEQLGYAPPIAFGSRAALDNWLKKTLTGLQLQSVGISGQGISAYGSIKGVPAFEQIWVKANFPRYRDIMKEVALRNYGEDAIAGMDADHVLAKVTLEQMPDAWVALFPVPPSSNRGFGNIEKGLPKYNPQTQQVDLTPLAAFKIYSGQIPKTPSELQEAMDYIRGQIMLKPFTQNYFTLMESEMNSIFIQRANKNKP